MGESERTLLDSFIDVAPHLRELVMDDVAVLVADTEKIRFCCTGEKIGEMMEPGTKIVPGSVAAAVIASGKKVVRQVGPEVFGFPYIGIGYPVYDADGKLLGSVSVISSLERQDALFSVANQLTSATEEMSATTEELAAQSATLASIGQQLNELDKQLELSVKETNGLLNMIRSVTTQTRLLGLNASIEAARAGAAGKGFAVVAGEIRHLAESSSRFLAEIEEILGALNKAKENLGAEIASIADISAEQAQAAKQLSDAARELSATARKLLQYAENLMQ
ncbi:MAG: methyl-accepting chemotaxis protein [Firmicutes bacterium]|nr:methyl-accepting chemotaxis protein [Bacillota bacterium]